MSVLTKNIKPVLLGIAALAAPLSITAARAQTISNVATIEWSAGGQSFQKPSNQVDVAVTPAPPPPPASITTYRFSTPSSGVQIPLPATMCRTSGGSVPIALRGVFAGTNTNPASLAETTRISANEPLVIAILAPGRNLDADAPDTFDVTLTTPKGDSETISVTETDANSGRFVGTINTVSVPVTPVQGDCALSADPGSQLTVDILDANGGKLLGEVELDILIDPFGVVFDSGDGAPVSGVTVTLVNTATGQPAQVFGEDGISSFPSTVVTGSTVTDSSGQVYNFPQGFYRFPFARPGTYAVRVEPPAPYTAPSVVQPPQLADFSRPDGGPYRIIDGSYGGNFTLTTPAPVRVDIPLDRPGAPLLITKTGSKAVAAPGDALQFRILVQNTDARRKTGAITVEDDLPDALKLRPATVRYNGELITPVVAPDGGSFSVTFPGLSPAASGLLTYLTEVRVDAQPGDVSNTAIARDNLGAISPIGESFTRIVRDEISDRFTIVGRVTEGACTTDPRTAAGIAGVRVMLEDGTYSITDPEGRYHFEGLKTGLHVVQVDPSTFPLDQESVDCAQNTRSAGSAISRFVEGRGGALKRADFRSRKTAPRAPMANTETVNRPEVMDDKDAAGAGRDWFEGQTPGISWVFPEENHNPRVKAIRIVVKHQPGQKVDLSINGKPVGGLTFEGVRKSSDDTMRVSIWRGVNLEDRDNALKAVVRNEDGSVAQELTRIVHYSGAPLNAQFLKDQSILVADGITRPVIAVRLTDRDGRPIHHGVTGAFVVPAPYSPAIEVDAQQAEQLSGLERAEPVWRVEGDNGVAYIELAPTTASGSVNVEFSFRDGEAERAQRVETWLDPGNRPWTVVGFAAGTVGFNTLDSRLEQLADEEDDINLDGRVALYAKGRVTGKWLMTLSYDSDKEEDETRFQGVIDPRSYYTIYADRSEQRYDAASVRRLYLKLERPQFYALFGDYETGINEPELARYQRAFNGIKAEYRSEQFSATAFGADTPNRFRREEIQGNGLSGPYALNARDIILNSERISIEVRDRLRSDRIIETRVLSRHIDYDIDYLSGTIRFREPVLSRIDGFDPQFIIAEYEVDGIGNREINAGGRVSWRNDTQKLQIGATAIHDSNDVRKTELVGVDVKYRPNLQTELRAEIAASDANTQNGNDPANDGTSTAWLVEAEHHGSTVDLLAYARRQEGGFGVGQLNNAESGTRKFGLDARVRITDELSVNATGYQEDFIVSDARRRAGSAEIQYRKDATTLAAGVTHAEDKLFDGSVNRSTIAKLSGSQRLLDNKLELGAQTEFALGGQNESVDFPARHTVSARYAVSDSVKILGAYEIADGDTFKTQTGRVGFEVSPWDGARFLGTANQQEISEYGPRTFAAYGLSQSLRVNEHWSVDFSLDGNETISGGVETSDIINPQQPVASGGFLSSTGALTEDFIAVTTGATYRNDDWSWASRAEYRAADTGNRYGFTSAVLRQIGQGSAIGGLVSYFNAKLDGGPQTETTTAELSWAHRPDNSRWSWLDKVEFNEDKVRGAVAGQSGPIGGALLRVDGDVTSRRVINSLSVNYTPIDRRDDGYNMDEFVERGEYSLFWGTRYVFDKFGPDDIEGWSNVVGLDAKYDLSDTIDIGAAGTVRVGTKGTTIAYSGGPMAGITPFENAYIRVGYNVVGFEDRDFEESRYTRSGPFVTFRIKFDQQSLGSLGL